MVDIDNNEKLRAIRDAAALNDLCFDYILDHIRPGVSELEIADKIDAYLLSHGASELAFPTICVSGARGCLPHGEPSSKLIEIGDFVTMDLGGIVNGYCGDMTRTVAVGKVSEKAKEIYDIVLLAQTEATKAVKAGISTRYIDSIARDIIADAGYGAQYIHGTGHGVGREVHEEPRLNNSTDSVLTSGLAVTVEPGIYIENELGVRIEDLMIVTEFGIINLVRSVKELIVL
ncbi:MAG: aminopeptidase P family protein [Clostridiales Family XIII bacterium]|jgi:Xaa-Pro aminopeptidase|nr:aminopeptidase P family protein [Clostridiales Family XIII bacterium]